ncbi:MAG TPA: hypothetical protein VJ608_11900 [Albitalea sp.]|nr:hypothetical protein [Albitalea sp.]
MRFGSFRTLLAVALHGLALLACADGPPPHGLRVTAQAVADWPTPAAFAERAAAIAAVPVRDVAVIGTRRYALSLLCRDDAECQRALARLRDPSFAAAVEVDARRSIPARPAASQSR